MRNKKKNKVLLLLLLLLGISIGFAALSTTLKINGTANVTKNTWSVYWANPVVTQGSVTSNVPVLSAEENETLNTIATWTTTLNLPGDFYEFTIDAVNNGSIDAMITGIEPTVTPALESYIKYSVTYADGVAIAENHLLPKKTGNTATVQKYKIRIEFLDTVTPTQMNEIPQAGLSYTFNYHITYSQATDAAVAKPVWALPEGKTANTLALGDDICFANDATQCFDFIRYDGNNAVMLAKYALNIGDDARGTATNKQDSELNGWQGAVPFSPYYYWLEDGTYDLKPEYGTSFPVDVYDSNFQEVATGGDDYYTVAYYVENYKDILETAGAEIEEARLLTYSEAVNNMGCSTTSPHVCSTGVSELITHTHGTWLGTASDSIEVNILSYYNFYNAFVYGGGYAHRENTVRPVIVVAKSNL